MRARVIVAASLTTALLLAGCTGRVQSSDDGSGKTNLAFWMVTQQASSATADLKEIVADFEKQNPDITVDLQFRAVDAHKDALRTTAGSAAGPDIYYNWAGPGLGGELVDKGVSLDLTSSRRPASRHRRRPTTSGFPPRTS